MNSPQDIEDIVKFSERLTPQAPTGMAKVKYLIPTWIEFVGKHLRPFQVFLGLAIITCIVINAVQWNPFAFAGWTIALILWFKSVTAEHTFGLAAELNAKYRKAMLTMVGGMAAVGASKKSNAEINSVIDFMRKHNRDAS
jgi:hypothetical protein